MNTIQPNFTPPKPDIIQSFVEMQDFYPPLNESQSDYPSDDARDISLLF